MWTDETRARLALPVNEWADGMMRDFADTTKACLILSVTKWLFKTKADVDALLREVDRLVNLAGEWLETDPSLRSTACIEVALNHAKELDAELQAQRQRADDCCRMGEKTCAELVAERDEALAEVARLRAVVARSCSCICHEDGEQRETRVRTLEAELAEIRVEVRKYDARDLPLKTVDIVKSMRADVERLRQDIADIVENDLGQKGEVGRLEAEIDRLRGLLVQEEDRTRTAMDAVMNLRAELERRMRAESDQVNSEVARLRALSILGTAQPVGPHYDALLNAEARVRTLEEERAILRYELGGEYDAALHRAEVSGRAVEARAALQGGE